ncbi:Carboxylic acid transporter [Entomophthora muscae]|uniref:Carboxylic acid transporter n=1 Tax=Entomophthora muscae TaxID=34485 RepID=A0ACC2RE79_9FUNG|nr:Carboxylic acid transporter [Entomophthora muscae]
MSEHWYSFLIEKPRKPENPWHILSSLNRAQAFTFTAAFLGWTLDAFDFHLVSYAIKDIAEEFGVSESAVAGGTTVTMMVRPIGALLFGLLADRFGRRIPLMVDVVLFSLLGLLTGFAQNLWQFLVLRALFGICMGGEWGLGASLAMESLPLEARGIFSGILQQGYNIGQMLASVVFVSVHDSLGWRAMFWIGSFPALLALGIRFFVPESEAWKQEQRARGESSTRSWIKTTGLVFKQHIGLLLSTMMLTTGLSFMSHGTQDLFPTFLRSQLDYTDGQVFATTTVASLGAFVGGILLGFFSQYLGRRRSIATMCLLGVCFVPIWGIAGLDSQAVLMLGSFLVQFCVQGAWGVVPALLTEISPASIRGTFPGLTYQLGTLISASAAQIEAVLGEEFRLPDSRPNYGLTQSVMAWLAFSLTFIVVFFTKENINNNFMDLHPDLSIEVPEKPEPVI